MALTPSYYAVIPANVRYSDKVCANAKLLYGEITALCQSQGFCWASNRYFSDLYRVNPTTVSQWITELKRAGFIRFEVDQSRGNERKIFLVFATPPIQEIPKTSSGKAEDPSSGKAEDNNTRVNSTKKRGGTDLLLELESDPGLLPFQSQDFKEAWADWETHRKEKRKSLTPTSRKLQLRKLKLMGEARAIACLRHSTAQGYEGLFEPKETEREPVASTQSPQKGVDPAEWERFKIEFNNGAYYRMPDTRLATFDSAPSYAKDDFKRWRARSK